MMPSTTSSPRSGVMTSSVQPSPATAQPVGGVRLEGAGGGGTDGDHPSALLMGIVHGLRGRGWHPVPLGVGRFVRFEGGHAGVQRDGSEVDAA